MHPAFSVIFFTVSSGIGYGLFILLALAQAFGLVKMDMTTFITSSFVALAFIGAGLMSSTFHLANPKNAWRAFFRFRTSWLSREGVFAVLFFPIALLYILGVWINKEQPNGLVLLLAIVTAGLGLATVFSTGMIYGCLKTIRQWNTALTPANYIMLSLASGAVLFTVLLSANGHTVNAIAGLAVGLLVLAAITKGIYYFWISKTAGPTINTATGFTRAQVRLFDTGNTAGTFLTDEFGYRIDPQTINALKAAVFALAFILPIFFMAAIASGHLGLVSAFLALVLLLVGLGVERWLFFAEARHVVRLYHGAQHT